MIDIWLKHYGVTVEVYFSIYHGACSDCQKTYLVNGLGSEPILYKLTDLIKKEIDAGGEIENLYPSGGLTNVCCNRTLTIKPANSKWDSALNQYIIERNNYGIKRQSKIIVTIKRV